MSIAYKKLIMARITNFTEFKLCKLCNRANRIKSNVTSVDEIRKVADFYEKLLKNK